MENLWHHKLIQFFFGKESRVGDGEKSVLFWVYLLIEKDVYSLFPILDKKNDPFEEEK